MTVHTQSLTKTDRRTRVTAVVERSPKMLPAERKRRIVDIVRDEDGCTVNELADLLDVSRATIRRDLQELDGEGLIERSHGGALPVESVARERTYVEKQVQNKGAKETIGRRAAEEIQDGQVVFFDSGTTTIEVARAAPPASFIAATNSPPLAMDLAQADVEVKLTGGTLRQHTWALVGPTGESFLERTNFDRLFLGTNAITPRDGLSTPNEDEARMKSLMCQRAQRVVLVADATKIGRRSFFRFAELSDVDAFVTDAELSTDEREAFETAGVEIIDGVVE